MAIDPRLGYDPGQNSGAPQTREQWVADVGTSMVLEFANATGGATSGAMSAELFARAGVPLPPEQYMGSSARNVNNALPPSVANAMFAVADYLSRNPQEAQAAGFMPSPTVSGGPVLGGADQERIFTATQNEKADAAANARVGMQEAGANARTAMQEAGANARNAADVAARMYDTNTRATVDRESIAATTATANADRSSRDRIADMDEAGRNRRFDVETAEDRRQFNATMVFNLFDRAVELSRQPVDWLAHQYFMANMGIPMTYLNATSMATQLGAFPPSGPSSMGAMVGGPAAVDGDAELAGAVGTQPRLVAVSEAVQANPGSPTVPGMERWVSSASFPAWAEQAGGEQQLEALVARARATELPQYVGENPVIQEAVQRGQGLLAAPPQPLAQGVASSMPAVPAAGVVPERSLQFRVPAGGMPGADGAAFAAKATGAFGGTAPAQPTVTTGGDTGTNRGVYTGPTMTQPAPAATAVQTPFGGVTAATGSGNTNPQGDQMLQALSTELGIPLEELKRIVPTNLLAGGYSKETIANSPVIQSIRNQTPLNFYRTAPTEGAKFGDIQAFGIPLGLRGGQDLNAQTYLQAPKSGQEQIEGVVNATGQYWPDAQEQMFRSSPLTNYTAGASGRRRFS